MIEKKQNQTFEEIVSEYLEGDNLKSILEFNEFLKENGLKTTKMSSKAWKVVYKGQKICTFKIWCKDVWFISVALYKNFTDTETFEKHITVEQREFLINNFRTVLPCGSKTSGPCKGPGKIEFLGKNYDKYCGCYPFFQDVNNFKRDAESFELTKQLTLVNKKILDDIAAAKKSAR